MAGPTIDLKALEKITKARTNLLIDNPFFGTLAMRLKLIEDNSVPTLVVNGKDVRYSAKFLNTLSNDVAKSALAHEVMHCVLDHCGPSSRGLTLNPEKWNHAADYVVNDILKKSGFTVPNDWLLDPAYSGMTAEQIYAKLPTNPPGSSGGPGSGNQGPGPLDQLVAGIPDPAMAQQSAAEWKIAAVQAANAAKAVGKLSAGIEQFVEQLTENKVDWKAELREFVTKAAKNDYSWSRANRKMLAAGFYLPGLYSEAVGQIVVASDESGSVDMNIVAAFSAEIAAIKEDMRPEKITVMHFDSDVRKVEEFGPDDPFQLTRFCSGGTDFRPAIEAAQALNEPPMCMIYLTDLYGPFSDHPPEFPVLWVTINKEVAPFGHTIPIEI